MNFLITQDERDQLIDVIANRDANSHTRNIEAINDVRDELAMNIAQALCGEHTSRDTVEAMQRDVVNDLRILLKAAYTQGQSDALAQVDKQIATAREFARLQNAL
jgi:hypothetical protein